MTEVEKVRLNLLSTGVAGLDEVLGGGLPEYSFTLLAGPPGVGKTTLVHQFVFANATEERPALYFTVVGEPSLKMLRYQQQLSFFDPSKIGRAIRFVDLSAEVLAGDLDRVLEIIAEHVQAVNPAFVNIDSFRTMVKPSSPRDPARRRRYESVSARRSLAGAVRSRGSREWPLPCAKIWRWAWMTRRRAFAT